LHSFTDPDFLKVVGNSLLITGLTVLLSLTIGTWAAYAFARFRFKGATVLSFSLIIARMMPPIVFIVPLFLLMQTFKLRNTYAGLILIFTTFNLPFTVWMLKSFFEEAPVELEEAAWIDGASRLQALLRIILPLTAPGLAATAVFAALLAWNEFLFALLLGGPETTTLPVFLASFIGERSVDWGDIMATAVLTVIPPTILVMLVQRNLIKGLTLGAVKG
jgi:multiple sugar transport system permease protein